MLRDGTLVADRQTRALAVVERNASMLAQIVGDILDVSSIIAGKLRLDLKAVDLLALVNDAIAAILPAADAKGVAVTTRVDPRLGPVSADPDRLQQVIWNLVSNAVKFTPQGGRVDVTAERDADAVLVAVADTGVGIADAFLPHVFERFRQADGRFSREHGGLGLGLAITRHLVEMHGGTITAFSEGAGRGAIFRVRLPRAVHDNRPESAMMAP
jgi:signal transduction histidine kinase